MISPDATVVCCCVLAGALYGLLGSVAILRRQALRGDVLAHAAWPGVLIAFALTLDRDPIILATGALFTALFASFCIHYLEARFPRLRGDGAPALILTGFFAAGTVAWSLIQRNIEGVGQAGLKSFLLGQAAAVQWPDAWLLLSVFSISLIFMFCFWRDMTLILFDREQAVLLGRNAFIIELILDILLSMAVVSGLTIVGVVVLSALLVAVPLAARPFALRLPHFFSLSTLLGGLIGLTTPLVVTFLENTLAQDSKGVPTGPVFVLLASFLAFLSLWIQLWCVNTVPAVGKDLKP